jgi:hypothetical protein
MTSIEWLVKELYTEMNMSGDGRVLDEILEEAKEMHKQEIIDAFEKAYGSGYRDNGDSGIDYYAEIFVSKGSDDTLKDYHIVEANEMVELPEQQNLYTEEQVREAIKKSRVTNTENIIGTGLKLHKYTDDEIIELIKNY